MPDQDLYRELQRHLDRMPVPFPATESGVEMRILKLLFTPEEAEVALELSAIPETLGKVHRRMRRRGGGKGVGAPFGGTDSSVHASGAHKGIERPGGDREEVCPPRGLGVERSWDREALGRVLDRMAAKGLIHRLESKGIARYCKAPLVVGIYEAQVDRLTPELEREVRAYFAEQFGRAVHTTKVPQMRTVPVNRSITVERAVTNYSDIRSFVERSPGPFGAQHCICRQGKDLTGEPCRQTHERRNCLVIGGAAESLIRNGVAIEITREKMLDLLTEADDQGLVLQPQNTLDPMFVCCCCGCCCGVLTTAKKLERPAEFFATEYVAEVDAEVCAVCGECAERCQMDALTVEGEPARLAAERCIGCGLCVTTCPTGGIRLRRLEGRAAPPKDTTALYTKMFVDRFGKWKAATAIAGHLVGRKF